MDCERCKDVLGEAILGPAGAVTRGELAAAETHAAGCPGCRADKAALEKLSAALPALDQIAGKIPERSVSRVHKQVMARVRKSAAEDLPKANLWHRGWIKWAVAAAVVVGVGLGALLWGHAPQKPQPAPQDQQIAVAPKPAVPAPWDGTADATAALKLLLRKFEAAKANPHGGDFAAVISLSDALVAKWPGAREGLEARKLISRCYTQMAEGDKARAAFLAYAEAAGKQARQQAPASRGSAAKADAAGHETVTRLMRGEVERLFGERDYLAALPYCEDLVKISPSVETQHYVWFKRGQYYTAIGEPDSAIGEYERIVRSKDSSPWTQYAFGLLPSQYISTRKFDEAVAICREMAKRFPDNEHAAYAACQIGVTFMCRGGKYLPQAISSFNDVINHYPQTTWARDARGMLAQMNKQMLHSVDAGDIGL